jgi:signal transduction histidine kinase/pSer/pThr/pTyr-binding forkhead associated (FHA) protein
MLRETDTRKTNFLNVQPLPPGETAHVWRLRLELSYDPSVVLDFDVEPDMIIGRALNAPDVMPIFQELDTEQLGVSRKHIMLRPTDHVLYMIDLGSTNGTQLNGHQIGEHIPHPLNNGDMISLGRLELVVRILQHPITHPEALAAHNRRSLDVILPQIARAINTQLTMNDVLKQVIEMARTYTPADEVSIWLVDEMSGQLYLEVSYGMSNQHVVQMPVANTLAGEVLKMGKPQRTNRRADGEPIKLKTGYMADGVIYVPLTLGQVQVGVISVVHREPGKIFTDIDEKIMVAIAEFTAVAIQNARLYQTSRQDLARKAKVVAALQYILAHDVRHILHSIIGYSNLLQADDDFQAEHINDMLQQIRFGGENLLELFERAVSMARLSQERIVKTAPCSLIEIASAALENIRDSAHVKAIDLQSQVDGNPYLIHGDAEYLYLSIYNLLDNAVKFTPEGSEVKISLNFAPNAILIRVTDQGPGIPEEDLPDLFNRYFLTQLPNGFVGLGLGLEIVRATVEAHMGTVNAYNRKHGGAEFVITLPATVRTDWAESAGAAQ